MGVNKHILSDKLTGLNNLVMMPNMPTFGEKYKAWREQKGVSNYKVWKQTGVAQSNLSNMESGTYTPSDEVLKKIASVPELDITYDQLKAWQAMDHYSPEALRLAFEQFIKTPEDALTALEIAKRKLAERRKK